MEAAKTQMRKKIEVLNKAAKAYYQDGLEIMSNFEYDRLYDELEALEKATGVILAGSPTQQVGYAVLSALPKEAHASRMLSLDKTKDRESLSTWLDGHRGILSWKLDGLTIVLTYKGGRLLKALTRGNGDVGEVITNNARMFSNLPLEIPYKGSLVIRGEAVIRYSDFEKLNASIPDADAKYKNPRNLCSGSVRQLNNEITARRNVNFFAFSLVEPADMHFDNSRQGQLEWLKGQGFDVVDYRVVTPETVVEAVGMFEEEVEHSDLPSDGLVLVLDDISYSKSLGTTSKFPRDAIAFKWRDQVAETSLRAIEWSASRTGLINPVAIFDPVELEGTSVSRASVHNISVLQGLRLGIGDIIRVYKANMIIPQIAENLTGTNNVEIPSSCPVCSGPTRIKDDSGIKTLFCTNPNCEAKQIKRFTLFVSRDGMNIDGLSEATLEKLIAAGLIKRLPDLFHMARHEEAIVNMEGFGKKSFDNLIASIDKARETTPERLLYALGIPGIGVANAKVIAKACERKWDKIVRLTGEALRQIDGIGDVMAEAYVDFFADETKRTEAEAVVAEVRLDESVSETADFFSGLTFVITGALNHYANRDVLKEAIEQAGGKTAGSVSKKTSYLVNNDVNSTSGKNKKAKELGVPIISEETIKTWLETGVVVHA